VKTDTDATRIAAFAGLLADPTRVTFLLALLDGRAWTAGELAARAGVAASTASAHLDRLVGGGLLAEQRHGRHRYVRLAGPHVAELVEELGARVTPAPPAPTLRAANASAALVRGRTCYDHLAGRLGVAVTDALLSRGLLDAGGGLALTARGAAWFDKTLGIAVDERRGSRPIARACLDWTERRPHLAGVAGARLCLEFFERGWIDRAGHGRAVRVTPAGGPALRDLLGLDATALE
jgi:DNA-binding transcriptional ArsR family regulator